MRDYLVKALALNGKVRAYAARTTDLVNELQTRHDTWPTASAALGRTATVGAMIGAMLKGQEKVTLQIKGDGPIGQIVVDANAESEVRGYVYNPHIDLPLNNKGKLDVAKAVGNGYLYVIKDLGLKEPYRGSVPLISGEIGDDFTYYFSYSEQTPSAVGVGVLVNPNNTIKAAGGFIVQVLPGVTDDEVSLIEEHVANLPAVSSLIDEGLNPEEILEKVFPDTLKVIEKKNIVFKCNCSDERIRGMLISFGKEEIEDMIAKEGKAEVVCQFCSTNYQFSKKDLEDILNEL